MPRNDETRDPPATPVTQTRARDAVTPSYSADGTREQTPEQVAALSGASSDSSAPPVVAGYEIGAKLGEGGMGVVYRAREIAFDRDVAIKLLKDKYRVGSPGARRFLEEARVTAQLQHPAIPPVHHIGELPDGRPFLAMKLIKGDTLADRLAAESQQRAGLVTAFSQVCQALAYAHSRRVIHRDLKPANVMVGAFGEVLVMDWGLAKVLTDAPEPTSTESVTEEATEIRTGREPDLATQAGSVMGTPAYMAPEQAAGEIEKVDERADVFGLGAMLCAILTGRPPYSGTSTDAVRMMAIRGETAGAFARLDACDADPELVALCKRCLATDRAARPRNADELAKALAAHLAAVEERARQAELARVRAEERRKQRRIKWLLAGAVLLLLAVAATGATVARLWQNAEEARAEAVEERDTADSAKNDAFGQKEIAENAKAEALQAKDAAEKARAAEEILRQQVERERERLEVFEYARSMQVAQQQWRNNNFITMRALLTGANPKLRNWEWHYLDRLCDPSLLTFKAQVSVHAVSFNHDGTRIVTGEGMTARVRDAMTGRELFVMTGHTHSVSATAWCPDGTRIVTGSAAAGRQCEVKVWDAKTGNEIRTLQGHTSSVRSVAFSHDGSQIITSGEDKMVRVWDVKTGVQIISLEAGCASISPDGMRIVTGGYAARVLDAKTGREIVPLKGQHYNYSVLFSPEGNRVVTVNNDSITIWNSATGVEEHKLKGHSAYARAVSFSADGTHIAVAGTDARTKTLRMTVWDARSGSLVLTLKGDGTDLTALAFSPNGKTLVTATQHGIVKVWDAKVSPEVLTLNAAPPASFSPDGTRILAGNDGQTAKVWDAKTGREVLILKGLPHWVSSAAFRPDGTRIVTAGGGITAMVWDAKTGADVLALKGHTANVRVASFSPDGKGILTASFDWTARIWNATTGAEELVLRGLGGDMMAASFSPDSAHIVTGNQDGTAKVWNARTGSEILTLKGRHSNNVLSASFSPDGTRIVTGSHDGTAKVWDAKTGAEVLALEGHTSSIQAASFSPNGTRIVTGSHDGTAKVWDAKTGVEVLTFEGHTREVFSASFSSDGTRIVTGSADGTAKVWDARPFRENRPSEAAPREK